MVDPNRIARWALAASVLVLLADPAWAEPVDDGALSKLHIEPIVDARLRMEAVDLNGLEAQALTLRIRGGAEAKLGRLSLLGEVEATVAALDNYNAFPFAIADDQRRTQYAVIADPRNLELNRLQLQYTSADVIVTAGRQRINLDDQRWVGSVGWRQNEQTFDALRGEAKLGPLAMDLTYAISQRTIFGTEAGPRSAYRGEFLFAGVGAKRGPIEAKLFSYLLDYDEAFFQPNSSQTHGGIVIGTFPLGGETKLSMRFSYARQSDYGRNPFNYAADYWSLESGARIAGFNIAAGWEQLGSDNGRAVQTPMATLHKFNGWADLFLVTPAGGLQDTYLTIGKAFNGIKALPGLNAQVSFHQFDSANGDLEYGAEWDASAGLKLGQVGLLLKYANYAAEDFGEHTRKLWLQAEWAF